MASKRKLSYNESRPEKRSLTRLPSDLLGLVAENIGATIYPLSSFIKDEKVYTIEKKIFEKEFPRLLYDAELWTIERYYLQGFLSLLKAGKYDVDTFTKLFANFVKQLSKNYSIDSSDDDYMDALNLFGMILAKENYNNWSTENMQGLANFLINVYNLTDNPDIFLILTDDVGEDIYHRYGRKNSFGRHILYDIYKGEIKYDPIYQKIFNLLENLSENDEDVDEYEEEEKNINEEFNNLKIENKLNPKWKKDDGKCVMLTEEEFSTYAGVAYATEDKCDETKDLDEKEKKELLTFGYQQIMKGAIMAYNFKLVDGILKYIAPFYKLSIDSFLNKLDTIQLNYLMDKLKTSKKDSAAYEMINKFKDEITLKSIEQENNRQLYGGGYGYFG